VKCMYAENVLSTPPYYLPMNYYVTPDITVTDYNGSTNASPAKKLHYFQQHLGLPSSISARLRAPNHNNEWQLSPLSILHMYGYPCCAYIGVSQDICYLSMIRFVEKGHRAMNESKINRLQCSCSIKRHENDVNVPTIKSSTTFRGILICAIFRLEICKNTCVCSVLHWRIISKKSDIIWLRVHFNFDNNLTKISLEGRYFNYFLLIMVNMTCRISRNFNLCDF
jgi:hypothetical protein